jgi:hypothetical protein
MTPSIELVKKEVAIKPHPIPLFMLRDRLYLSTSPGPSPVLGEGPGEVLVYNNLPPSRKKY